MDTFVSILPAKRRAPAEPEPAQRQQVQLQITDLRKVSSLDAITRHAAALQGAIAVGSEPAAILHVLEQLTSCYVSVEILEATGIGRLAYRLSKHADPGVAAAATALYGKWRDDAKQAVHRLSKQRQRSSSAKKGAGVASGAAASAGASGTGKGGGGGGGAPSILDDVDIEQKLSEWDDASARGARLRRSSAALPGAPSGPVVRSGAPPDASFEAVGDADPSPEGVES